MFCKLISTFCLVNFTIYAAIGCQLPELSFVQIDEVSFSDHLSDSDMQAWIDSILNQPRVSGDMDNNVTEPEQTQLPKPPDLPSANPKQALQYVPLHCGNKRKSFWIHKHLQQLRNLKEPPRLYLEPSAANAFLGTIVIKYSKNQPVQCPYCDHMTDSCAKIRYHLQNIHKIKRDPIFNEVRNPTITDEMKNLVSKFIAENKVQPAKKLKLL
jgi:hypothetical protein